MKEIGKVNRLVVLGVVVVVVAVVGVAAVVMLGAEPVETKNLIFQLDYMPGGQHVQFYVAQKMFWPQLGLNVQMIRGAGSADTARKIGLGAVDIGVAGFDPGVQVKTTEIMPIKAVYCCILQNDAGLFYIVDRDAGRGIIDGNDLSTLKGKICGEPVWANVVLQMPAFLNKIGLEDGDVIMEHIDPGATIAALIRGDTDMTGTGLGEDVTYEMAVAEEGLHGAAIWFKDYGVVVLGDAVWTTEKMIRDDPDTVKKFVKGLQEAMVWTVGHLSEATEIMSDALTSWKGHEADLAGSWTGRFKNTMDVNVNQQHGIGYIPTDLAIDSIANTYVIHSIEPDFQLVDPTEAWTNEFIDSSVYPTSYPW